MGDNTLKTAFCSLAILALTRLLLHHMASDARVAAGDFTEIATALAPVA
ncbi:MAG TPA: hypothetical protein VJK02_18195 [Anaerolineales bacterium]|nr:hypothetical protein [Anaerolineales bacterium]